MAEAVTIPLITPNEPEAILVSLHVKEGQTVAVGDLLCVLETTKSTMEVIASQTGYVKGIRNKEGDTVKAGDVFAFLTEDPDWKPEENLQRSAFDADENPLPKGLRISQPALLLAQENQLDLDTLPPGVFITRELIEAELKSSIQIQNRSKEQKYDPKAVLIYGAGGHGKSVLEFLKVLGTYHIVGFVDDGIPEGENLWDVPVLGDQSVLPNLFEQGVRMAVNAVGGIGNVQIREKVFNILLKAGFSCPMMIHPTAFVEASAEISAGAQVFPFAYVGSDVEVGFGSIINTGAIVSHECNLGKIVNISPNAILAGGVTVGDGALIGMGVTVNLSVKIGEGARIGNGSTVKADVPPRFVVRAGTIFPS